MCYNKAMKWHKKHPRGIKNNWLGFDCQSSRQKTEQEIRDFYPKYVEFHKKQGNKHLSLIEYIESYRKNGWLSV